MREPTLNMKAMVSRRRKASGLRREASADSAWRRRPTSPWGARWPPCGLLPPDGGSNKLLLLLLLLPPPLLLGWLSAASSAAGGSPLPLPLLLPLLLLLLAGGPLPLLPPAASRRRRTAACLPLLRAAHQGSPPVSWGCGRAAERAGLTATRRGEGEKQDALMQPGMPAGCALPRCATFYWDLMHHNRPSDRGFGRLHGLKAPNPHAKPPHGVRMPPVERDQARWGHRDRHAATWRPPWTRLANSKTAASGAACSAAYSPATAWRPALVSSATLLQTPTIATSATPPGLPALLGACSRAQITCGSDSSAAHPSWPTRRALREPPSRGRRTLAEADAKFERGIQCIRVRRRSVEHGRRPAAPPDHVACCDSVPPLSCCLCCCP